MMRFATVRALMRVLALIALVGGSLAAFESTAVARECPDPSTPIETDRPDVTKRLTDGALKWRKSLP